MTNDLMNCINHAISSDIIDKSIVSICKKIRRIAREGRLKIDKSSHTDSRNTHLFKYIEFCNLSVDEFVTSYLSNLQPYMLTRFKNQEKVDSFICVLDNQYSVSLYIKLDITQFNEVVISFHENHVNGIAKVNMESNSSRHSLVPVIADSIGSHVVGTDSYTINVFIQRGLLVVPIDVAATKKDDIYLVRKSDIDNNFIDYCNSYLTNLYTSDLDIDISNIQLFDSLQQISFTSYSRDMFSTISLIIDSLFIQDNKASRCAADFALVTFVSQKLITLTERDDLIILLKDRYRVRNHKEIDMVISRIESSMNIVAD